MSQSPTKKRRVRIACNQCRSRRKRCDGEVPCRPCQVLGLDQSCIARDKARPGRTSATTSYASIGSASRGSIACLAEAYIEDLAAGSGHYLDLRPSNIEPVLTSDDPTMPAREYGDERRAIEAFLKEFSHLFAWVDADTVRQAHTDTFERPDNAWDDYASALASISLGQAGRAEWCSGEMKLDGKDAWLGVDYFRSAWASLQRVTKPSFSALAACHCLHHLALSCCGPREIGRILECMAWHAKGLEMSEDRDRHRNILFSTFYKDSWFSSLLQCPPCLPDGFAGFEGCEVYGSSELNRGAAPDRLWTALVGLERQASCTPLVTDRRAMKLRQEKPDLGPKFDKVASILAMEKRTLARPFACLFAEVRYCWITLTHAVPDLSTSSHHATSLPIVARGAIRIIRMYSSLFYTPVTFGWCDLRRLSTSSWLIARCTWEGELDMEEGGALLQTVLNIVDARWNQWPPGRELRNNVCKIAALLGLVGLAGVEQDSTLRASEGVSNHQGFDFSIDRND